MTLEVSVGAAPSSQRNEYVVTLLVGVTANMLSVLTSVAASELSSDSRLQRVASALAVQERVTDSLKFGVWLPATRALVM